MKDLIIIKVLMLMGIIEVINLIPMEMWVKLITQGCIAAFYIVKTLKEFNHGKEKKDN